MEFVSQTIFLQFCTYNRQKSRKSPAWHSRHRKKLAQFTWHIIANIAIEKQYKGSTTICDACDFNELAMVKNIESVRHFLSPSDCRINCLFVSVQFNFLPQTTEKKKRQTNRWCERFLSANCYQDSMHVYIYSHAARQLIAATMYYHNLISLLHTAHYSKCVWTSSPKPRTFYSIGLAFIGSI